MSKIIKINTYFFGKINVQLNVAFITEMMNSLNEVAGIPLFPNVIPGQKVDLIAGKAEQISNIMFRSQNDEIQVVFAETGVNCVLNFSANQEEGEHFLQEKIDLTKNIMDKALNGYGSIGSRLAINVDMIGPEHEDEHFHIGQMASDYAPYYREKVLTDFSMQINSRESILLQNTTDAINVISNYSIVQNNSTKKKLMLCRLDINTIPENAKMRFSNTSLTLFVQQVLPIVEEIKQNFEAQENVA